MCIGFSIIKMLFTLKYTHSIHVHRQEYTHTHTDIHCHALFNEIYHLIIFQYFDKFL